MHEKSSILSFRLVSFNLCNHLSI